MMDSFLESVISLAEHAGEMMLSEKPVISTYKGSKDNYATEADERIQDYLKNELLALLPDSVFMGEENHDYSKGDTVWIVDPIDGTVNYARGLSMSVVSIGLVKDSKSVLGVVHNPYLKQTFYAVRGEGAFLNGEKIHVSDRGREDAMVSTAWCAYDKDLAPPSFKISERLHRECSDIRRFGTAAYEMCLLAKGSLEIYFEMLLRPWDYAAASLIVEEAGGICSSIDGPLDPFDQCAVLAANSKENMDYLKTVIKEEGGVTKEGSIWRD